MAFIKQGEALNILGIESLESCIPAVNSEVLENFRKFANNLKKIAPRAEDFLYFSGIMMHAAEAAAINEDGTPKLTASGKPVQVGWDKTGGTWKWVSNDPTVRPYKNSNCFVAGTKILMSDGSVKNIEDISSGDMVITHKGRARRVVKVAITPHNDKVITLKVSNNVSITCTENHPFYVARNETKDSNHACILANGRASRIFVDAGDLRDTDVLLQPVMNQVVEKNWTVYQGYRVLSVLEKTVSKYNGDVYNFEVEEDHSYIANGAAVHNCDIFPEEELIKAHKKWIHKPLCIDHKSSSVDHVRGYIVDTYYDRSLKRVVALCALDKVLYPDLARQISTLVSTSLSMGTAVGKAICSDCYRVARSEADFCQHMKNKSCYGEINVDLNPLELSIVVNGADPRAHIKHIIAAANTLNNYVDLKQRQLAKLANMSFSAQLNVQHSGEPPAAGEVPESGAAQINIQSNSLEDFRQDLSKAVEQLASLSDEAKKSVEDTNDTAFNQSSGSLAMTESESAGIDSNGLQPPHQRYASVGENALDELRSLIKNIEGKISQAQETLNQLSNTKEEPMSFGNKDINKQGYFQGGGGVNEPTPGQPKYTKDPLNEELRLNEDKQMVGEPPFPGVGDVDGLHPSPSSAEPSDELERKRMLARAQAEENSIRRQAIVQAAKEALNKRSYFQGGGGVNEPTPGKVKYPKDSLNEEDRDGEDKQMVGQPPFPGVGKVDGLHPSPESADVKDELKRKQMLQRAGLRARFVKAAKKDGTLDTANSAWEVFLGDKLLVSASVSDLSGGNVDVMYDSIATKDFGSKLIEKIKVHGSDGLRSLIKKSQAMPPAAPPMDAGAGAPALPEAGAPAAPEGETGHEHESVDTGKEGDPKESVLEMAEKARDMVSDLVEGVRVLVGDQAEMGEAPMAAAAADRSLFTLRRELNGALVQGMKEAVANLKDHQQELEMIAGMYDKGAISSDNTGMAGSIVEDALNECKSSLADGFKLMTAFVKYARGTQALIKNAEMKAELKALAETSEEEGHSDESSAHDGDLMDLINDTNADLDDLKDLGGEVLDHNLEEEHLMPADDNSAQLSLKPGETVPADMPKDVPVVVSAGLETKASRTLLRAKLAADALGKEDDGEVEDMSKAKFNDLLDQADGLADGQTHLDVKPSNSTDTAKFPLGLVETLPEQNKAMLEVAKAPPKVRKEAEAIDRLIKAGKLDPSDLDALVAEANVDKAAVDYWKKYFGQVGQPGSEFATELVKEHVKAELETAMNTFRVKLARAYELAYEMRDRGLCGSDRATLSREVDAIMKCNDESFEVLKRTVASHSPVLHKEASRLPVVGLFGTESGNTGTFAGSEPTMMDRLSNIFDTNSTKKNGSF